MIDDYHCEHSDEERSFIGTWASHELHLALMHGWKVTKVYRVLDYAKGDRGIFKEYIREFMRMKIHASGFDKSIAGNWEAEEKFINDCREIYGIEIDRQQMISNPGKRALAKLMLNNLCMFIALKFFNPYKLRGQIWIAQFWIGNMQGY